MKNIICILIILLNLLEAKGRLKKNAYTAFKESFNDTYLDEINSKIRRQFKIFCIIVTSEDSKNEQAIHQKNTWIQRCDGHVFVSDADDSTLPSKNFYGHNYYSNSFEKIKNGFTWIWKNIGEDYDWFLKVEDDTYVVMENLRAFLVNEDPKKHGYHGFRMHLSDDDMYTFMHAGAGYVLSKRSFSDLVTIAFKNDLTCNEKENSFEDVVIGKCLKSLGVVPSVSLDTKGRILFNPLNPLSGASPDYMNGFINVANFKYKQGIDSMSDFPITFHDVSKDLMYGLEYLLYHAEVMGRRSRLGRMFDKLNDMNKRYKINKKIKQIEKFSRYQFVKY